MCHINMLKGFHVNDDTKPVLSQSTVTGDPCVEGDNHCDDFVTGSGGCDIRCE